MAKRSGTTSQTLDDRIIFDLPTTVDPNFSSALRTVLVERTTASWKFAIQCLQEFVLAEGHARPPTDYIHKNGFKLGFWSRNVRNEDRRKKLTLDRVKQLESLPGWAWT